MAGKRDTATTVKSLFSSDPEFCSECGAILPLPGNSDWVVCRVCKNKVPASIYDGLETVTEIRFENKWMNASKFKAPIDDGTGIDRKCGECGHNKMTYFTAQTRSADEGQTVFYTCLKCKNKTYEFS